MKIIFISLISLLFPLFTWENEQICPAEGFRFNCGIDICTFPYQYCDTADGECKYCNDDVCRLKNDEFPEQCTSKCAESKRTIPSAQIETKEPQYSKDTENVWMILAIASFCLNGVLALVLIAGVWYLCHVKRKKCYYHVPNEDRNSQLERNLTTNTPTTQKEQNNFCHDKDSVINNMGTSTAPPESIACNPTLQSDEASKVSSKRRRSIASSLRDIKAQPEDKNGNSDNLGDAEILPKTMETQEIGQMRVSRKITHPEEDANSPKYPNDHKILNTNTICAAVLEGSEDSGFTSEETATKTLAQLRVLPETAPTCAT